MGAQPGNYGHGYHAANRLIYSCFKVSANRPSTRKDGGIGRSNRAPIRDSIFPEGTHALEQ